MKKERTQNQDTTQRKLMTTNGYQSMDIVMLKGRRICPECKGNGHLRTEMKTIVQCLNCWSEGEIDETFGLGIMTPIIPDELQPSRKRRLISFGGILLKVFLE